MSTATAATPVTSTWFSVTPELKVHLYFFWSRSCPHCQEARPFIEDLARDYPWLSVHSLELTGNPENLRSYRQMAGALGRDANSVPAFLFCGGMLVGFDSAATTGALITEQLEKCYARLTTLDGEDAALAAPPEQGSVLTLPLLGEVEAASLSLPVLTIVLAGLDSFNPCAFFVLLFLLSLLVHARSRARMLMVGGVFVFFSGFVYFLFMVAWLNVFAWLGQLRIVTVVAATLALIAGAINVKDYFWFKRGISLSISDRARPKLFERMRGLLGAQSLPSMLVGASVLAVVANSYELLCTAGFPMVYTRILTLSDVSPLQRYLYLVVYNVVYILPLLLIVALFSITLGARKLTEHQGQVLKLLSGLMMVQLSAVLLVFPQWLNEIWLAALLIVVAVIVTFGVERLRTRGA